MAFQTFMVSAAILLSVFLSQALADMAEPNPREFDIQYLLEETLGDIHGQVIEDTLNSLANRLSANHISDELLLVGAKYIHSADMANRNKAIRAIQLLGSYGTTNALDGLEQLLFAAKDDECLPIARTLLSIDRHGEKSFGAIRKFCDDDGKPWKQRFFIYLALENVFDENAAEMSASEQRIAVFLANKAVADIDNSVEIDLMLCRNVSGYGKSLQRKNLAEAVLNDAEDLHIQRHFQAVRNALSKVPDAELENISSLSTPSAIHAEPEQEPAGEGGTP